MEESEPLHSENASTKVRPSPGLKNVSGQSLLSIERSQKFDLLLHLLSNIPEAIVLCGPDGIGKSTMLDLIQSAKSEVWSLCRINASDSTTMEQIRRSIAACFGDCGDQSGDEIPDEDFDRKFDRLKRDEKILVLMIDDAGEMQPGLITSICNFADPYTAVHPVFTMTADRLHLTLSSDPAIGNCQIIEIPPLTESQCGEFLRNLSGHPKARISAGAISPSLVQHVYRESHGVPGKLLEVLPRLSSSQLGKSSGMPLSTVAVVTLLLGVAVGYLLWNFNDNGPAITLPLNGSESSPSGVGSVTVEPLVDFKGGSEQLSANSPAREDPEINTPIPVEGGPLGITEDGILLDFERGRSNSSRDDPDANKEQPDTTLTGDTLEIGPKSDESGDNGSKTVGLHVSGFELGMDIEREAGARSSVAEATGKKTGSGEIAVFSESSGNRPTDFTVGDKASSGNPTDPEIESGNSSHSDKTVDSSEEDPAAASDPAAKTGSRNEQDAQENEFGRAVHGQEWVRSQNPDRFTLQLIAVKDLSAMKKFVRKNSSIKEMAVFRTRKKGANWYALISGVYPSLSAARSAVKTLPEKLQNAWPRKFRSVQASLIRFNSE